MVASNVVWNLTVPDTSPMIQYRNFARQCPLNNGVLQCTTDSAHVSNSTDSSITISFYGTAIYLFGDVDDGTRYTTALDYGAAVDGAVQGKNLLASYANVPNSRAGGSLHQIVLSTTRFRSNSLLTFTGAVISVDTGLPSCHSAKPVFSNYSISDPSVTLTPGWVKDGDYVKSGTEFSQVATLKFHGSGVMVYGLCSNTHQEFSVNNFGQVETDTEPFGKNVYDSSDSLIFNKRPYRTDRCLLYYNTGLPEGDHNLTYTSNKNNVFLSTFQVVSVNGSRSDAGGQGGGNNNALGTVGKILGIGIPAVVGIVIGAIVLLLLCCIWGCCLRRRKVAARVYLPPPAPQEDPKPASEASQPIIVLPVATFAPPPPPPPPPTQVYVFTPDSPSETAQQWQPPAGRVEIPNSQLPRTRSQRYPVGQYAQAGSSQPRRAPSQTRSEAERRSTSFENAVPYDTRVALAAAAGFPPSPQPPATPDPPSVEPARVAASIQSGHSDAYAGRVVLSADGISDQRSLKGRNEYARSRSGSSAQGHRRDEDGLPDVPPPIYEESPRPRA